MVVIREGKDYLNDAIGSTYVERLRDFSDIVGFTYEEVDADIKLEFNPDRPDLFSFFALKNAMKSYYDRKFWAGSEFKGSKIKMDVSSRVRKIRPYVLAFVAVGGKIADRLDHLIEYQERIHSVIGKDRKKVSIGIHDLGKISPPFRYEAVDPDGMHFETYDSLVRGSARDILGKHPKGIEFSHLLGDLSSVPVILDSQNDVMSMPPIINGMKSKITGNSEKFFVDLTGTDPISTRNAFYLLAYEMVNLGYRIELVEIPQLNSEERASLYEFDGRKIAVNSSEIRRLLGFDIEKRECISNLRKMGYRAEPSSSGIDVFVPGNRIDVMGAADAIEDIGKSVGFTEFPESELELPIFGKPYTENEVVQVIKDLLNGTGYQEVRSFVVTSQGFYKSLKYVGNLTIRNPKSADYSVIRDRLYLNALEFFRRNKRRALPQKIYEVGEVIIRGEEKTDLCIMINDAKASFSSVKQATDYLLSRVLGRTAFVRESEIEGIIPGRGGYLVLDDKDIGIIGEVHPSLLVEFDLQNPVSLVEISLTDLGLHKLYS